jgi:hypothetical protein
MASANPVGKAENVSTLPEGKGNNLIKVRCPECDTKYGYWEEEGDPGCMECQIREAGRINKAKAEAKKAAASKK